MSTVLESIIEGVLEDVHLRERPLSQMREELQSAPELRGALQSLSRPGTQIISEVKRSSPSKGLLADISSPGKLAEKYQEGGAAVVSVLTEERRFKGSIADFIEVRSAIEIPVLRKDFIVTEFQVLESRIIGADLLLLIVAGLSQSQYRDFHQMATELGMDVLVEVHNQEELERALDIKPLIIGVNSRNLKTLELDFKVFDELLPLIPSGVLRVAESGISERHEVAHIEALGGKAILVGETLVKAGNPQEAISRLIGREGTGSL
ncbi:MAG: indole-3-glycerol phosphate synthase TrpC [Actinomycetes bacterium]